MFVRFSFAFLTARQGVDGGQDISKICGLFLQEIPRFVPVTVRRDPVLVVRVSLHAGAHGPLPRAPRLALPPEQAREAADQGGSCGSFGIGVLTEFSKSSKEFVNESTRKRSDGRSREAVLKEEREVDCGHHETFCLSNLQHPRAMCVLGCQVPSLVLHDEGVERL